MSGDQWFKLLEVLLGLTFALIVAGMILWACTRE